ncbi:HupE/UreJ family protein [Panacagrimonas perspica]|nr:HupE/UreJ family protein [Panacagrimonas perspica]
MDGAVAEGQWDIALRDLDHALGLDADQDGAITWGELRKRHADVAAYALTRLDITSDRGACPAIAVQHLVDEHTDGAYAVIRFRASCPAIPTQWALRYRLFFDLDPQHRGLLKLEYLGQTHTAILSRSNDVERVGTAPADPVRQFVAYVRDGVWHIWIGYDHILFLLSLLLPSVLLRKAGNWQAVDSLRESIVDVLKIVTAFTFAHSITLSLATFQVVSLPSRWVESSIAASVIVAALNNLRPIFPGRRWTAAFFFGLIHGLGFANVLSALGLPQAARLSSLVGFNVGVELGQLAVVAIFLPLAYRLRHTWLYQRLILTAGSVLIAVLATVWLLERSLELSFSAFYRG